MGKKTVSLVLSSGGARGMAHIGAIEALEEKGFEIVSIAGCSAGALIGGIYATGHLPKFKDWICNLDRIDVFSLMDFTLSSKGFIKGEKVFGELKKLIADCDIEDLAVPFRCNAVEIPSGKEKVFKSGSLYEAIRASVSIPTVLMPARIGRNEYIDGGILNPIPFNLLEDKYLGELIAAVDLNGPKDALVKVNNQSKKEPALKLPSWLKEYQKKFSSYFSSGEKEQKEVKHKGMSSVELLNYSFDLLQDKLSELVIEKHRTDILIEISREQAGTLEFHRAEELIQVGKEKMMEAIEEFEDGSQ
ncbi:patatin-like phospholipase family protein [Cecembia calidifontis]|jgi:NTE family protein|uniref:NTE family protein n=1 Tax=Cecembia calidifontis TaxID=1187080 RepID=A0A4Q7P8Y2_9BACT|nr:patatin-like phospholipase family protein [Cecembia calidifontis]RZS95960.1 NTE family protein [Cecembia calidifontis]